VDVFEAVRTVLAVRSYQDKRVGRGKKNRKPLGDVAHRERYGQPYQ
jgi:hypothetical protein